MKPRIIFRNWGWKLGSVLLGCLLWVAVSAEPDVISTHSAPLLYRNLAPSLLITGNVPETIHLELRGPAGQLTPASLADTVATLDLAGVAGPGERTFTIATSNLNLPRRVTFLRAVPSQFRLSFAKLAEKDVPVLLRFAGQLPAGYHVISQTASPSKLRITGAETRVAEVTSVETDALSLEGMTQSGDHEVNAFISDPQVRFESSPLVTVHVEIGRQ